MGTTANRAYTYPDSTSDTQIWAQFEELADDVDADVEAIDNRVAGLESAPHASLILSGSITNNSIQLLDASSAEWNTGSMWSAGTPSRITITRPGIYEVGVILRFASQATASGQRNARIYLNGTEAFQFANPAVTNYNATNIICAGVCQMVLTASNYVQAYAYQNSGGTLALTGNNRLWARLLQE